MTSMDNHSCEFRRPDYECPTCGLHISEYVEGLEDRAEEAEHAVIAFRKSGTEEKIRADAAEARAKEYKYALADADQRLFEMAKDLNRRADKAEVRCKELEVGLDAAQGALTVATRALETSRKALLDAKKADADRAVLLEALENITAAASDEFPWDLFAVARAAIAKVKERS